MTLTIIEVLLCLALVYAVIGVLAMHLQELIAGTLFKRRAVNLRRLVCTVFAGDQELTDSLFASPLVAALFAEKVASRGMLGARGPSAIPPDLFARALLMVLNDGEHPASEFNSPAAFLAARRPATVVGGRAVDPPPRGAKTWSAVAALVPGHPDWGTYEAAISQWFQDAGDRADGWYNREAKVTALMAATVLVLAFNVDTFHIVEVLGADPELRVSLSNVAVLADNQRRGVVDDTPFDTAQSAHPEARVVANLNDAIPKVTKAFTDSDITSFALSQPMTEGCRTFDVDVDANGDPGLRKRAHMEDPSAAASWLYRLPGIAARVGSVGVDEGRFATRPKQCGAAKKTAAATPAAAASAMHAAAAANDVRAAAMARAASAASSAAAAVSYAARAAAMPVAGPPAASSAEGDARKKEAKAATPAEAASAKEVAANAKKEAKAATAAAAAAAEEAASAKEVAANAKAVAEAMKKSMDDDRTAPVACERAPERDVFVLQAAHACIAQMSAAMVSATSATRNPDTQAALNDARRALAAANDGIATMIARERTTQLMGRKFILAPDDFRDCASEAGGSRGAFDGCLAAALQQHFRVPVGWLDDNRLRQFCIARSADPGGHEKNQGVPPAATPASTSPAASAQGQADKDRETDSWPDCGEVFPGNEGLGLPSIRLVPRPNAAWFVIGGWLVSILMVSFGATFWFDTLGRFVQLRSAATVRERVAAPPASPGAAAPAGASPLPAAPTPGGTPKPDPFSSARNVFEHDLPTADLVRLQQALHVTATGTWDTATRAAIRDWCNGHDEPPTDEMSDRLFARIVGRPVVGSPFVPSAGGALRLRQVHEAVPALAVNLMAGLDFAGRIPGAEKRFSDDLRALVVLRRFKAQSSVPFARRAVVLDAVHDPQRLDTVESKELLEILADRETLPRDAHPWLDWAVGELGIVENDSRTRDGSNPRILEYLDVAVKGTQAGGDHTAWCGAFVAWVLRRHAEAGVPASAPAAQPACLAPDKIRSNLNAVEEPLRAAAWSRFGRGPRAPGQDGAAALAGACAGDILLFKPQGEGSSGHVGFLMEVPAEGAAHVLCLAGNQSSGKRVSIESWPIDRVLAVMALSA